MSFPCWTCLFYSLIGSSSSTRLRRLYNRYVSYLSGDRECSGREAWGDLFSLFVSTFLSGVCMLLDQFRGHWASQPRILYLLLCIRILYFSKCLGFLLRSELFTSKKQLKLGHGVTRIFFSFLYGEKLGRFLKVEEASAFAS